MKLERAIKEKKGEKKKNVKVLPRNIGGKSANVFFHRQIQIRKRNYANQHLR